MKNKAIILRLWTCCIFEFNESRCSYKISVKKLLLENQATSKTWTQTLDSDPEKPGPRKTWTRKKLDTEKPEPKKTWTKKKLDPEKSGH